jgi:hypothetical protein
MTDAISYFLVSCGSATEKYILFDSQKKEKYILLNWI